MPVERQVLIVLKRFSTYRNGISLHDVVNWASIEYGIVNHITRRVIIAILNTNL